MKKYLIVVVLLSLILLNAPAQAEENAKEKSPITVTDETERVSYSIGAQVGKSLANMPFELNMEIFVQAIEDVRSDRELAMESSEIDKTMREFQVKMREEQQRKQLEEGTKNMAEGKAFLEANAKKEGVKVLESGLQYKVLKEGTGNKPAKTDKVKVHYKGTLIDGAQFDSSYERDEPAVLGVGQVIAGWTEALQLMQEGGKWELYIPSDLAYGERGRPSIPSNSVLVFEVELLEIINQNEITVE